MIAYIVIRNEFLTNFMQNADVFEKFKFVGKILEIQIEFKKSIAETFAIMRDNSDVDFQMVGLIVPNHIAIVKENHKVMSDGEKWFLMEDFVKSHGLNQVSWVP